jgi:hypothetical protein
VERASWPATSAFHADVFILRLRRRFLRPRHNQHCLNIDPHKRPPRIKYFFSSFFPWRSPLVRVPVRILRFLPFRARLARGQVLFVEDDRFLFFRQIHTYALNFCTIFNSANGVSYSLLSLEGPWVSSRLPLCRPKGLPLLLRHRTRGRGSASPGRGIVLDSEEARGLPRGSSRC